MLKESVRNNDKGTQHKQPEIKIYGQKESLIKGGEIQRK